MDNIGSPILICGLSAACVQLKFRKLHAASDQVRLLRTTLRKVFLGNFAEGSAPCIGIHSPPVCGTQHAY